MVRELVLDTETTGLDHESGHRIVEIGIVELENHLPTGNDFHYYLNPERDSDKRALEVHGLSREFLTNQPKFSDIAEEFVNYLSNSKIIIHNAPFDVGFINHELKLASTSYPMLEEICEIEDSLTLARDKYPGQRNSLDALAMRFDISGYDRTFHGALLDANILADVYMQLTGGQSKFEFTSNGSSEIVNGTRVDQESIETFADLVTVKSTKSDIDAHEKRLSEIEESNNLETLWRKF